MENKYQKNLPTIMSFVIFSIVVGFYFFDFLLQVLPGIFAKDLSISFSLNAKDLGTLSASYFFSYALMQIPAGFLYDKFGGKKVLFISVIVASLGTYLFSIADSIMLGKISRVLMGAGCSCAFLGSLYFILRWFPEKYFATLAGTVALIGSFGAVFGEVFLSNMLLNHGWRNTTFYLAFWGAIIGILISFFVKNHPYNDELQTKKETSNGIIQEIGYLLTHSQIWALSLFCFLNWAVVSVFGILWGVPYLKKVYAMSLTDASWAISLIWAGVGLGSPITGWISDSIMRRKPILIICSILAIISLTVILYMPGIPIFLTYTTLFTLGCSASGTTVVFAAAKDIVPVQTLNLCNGLINMMAVTSALVLQPLIGKIMDLLWIGKKVGDIRAYSSLTYEYALVILLIAAILSLLTACFWLKESCKKKSRTPRRKAVTRKK